MEEWKEYKLGELITLNSGGTPDKNNKSYWDGEIPWISAKFMYDDYLYSSELKISQDGLTSGSRLAPKGSILLLTRGSGLFNRIPVCYTMRDLAYNQDVKCIESKNKELVSTEYLFYWLMGNKDSISAILETTGIGAGKIDTNRLKNIRISLPPKEYQQILIGFAESIMHKIEVNRRINENLEQQAQALFKSWFVDFEPFKDQPFVESELGMIPQGWRVEVLGDVCKCILGGTPSRNKKEYWNGDIAWINSGEINEFRIVNPSEYITEEGLKHSATKLLPKKTTVLAITGATLGQVSLLEIGTCANQSVIGVLENDNVPYEFIYPLINIKITELCSHMTGGAQQHINKNNVEQLKIVLPSGNFMAEYKEKTKPIYSQITNCCFESRRLAELRDTLLPRLMSGEIKISDINS